MSRRKNPMMDRRRDQNPSYVFGEKAREKTRTEGELAGIFVPQDPKDPEVLTWRRTRQCPPCPMRLPGRWDENSPTRRTGPSIAPFALCLCPGCGDADVSWNQKILSLVWVFWEVGGWYWFWLLWFCFFFEVETLKGIGSFDDGVSGFGVNVWYLWICGYVW